MFDLGQWVIDTKKRTTGTVLAKIEGVELLYVVEGDDTDECYIVKENRLIPYDKSWFDENPEQES